MIAIIDYGVGNLRSVEKAFAFIGHKAIISSDPRQILEAEQVILPGVGAFGKSMDNLTRAGMVPVVQEVVRSGRPFLGICLGLQMLFEASEEYFGTKGQLVPGLGIFKGQVAKFAGTGLKIPQIGWNQFNQVKETPIFHGIPAGSFVYFVHSYYVKPQDEGIIACRTNFGIDYCSGISIDNVHAVQFHPEKSSQIGLKILKNFAELKPL